MKIVAFVLVALGGLSSVGCGDGTGACTGCCGPGAQTYCKNGWTRAHFTNASVRLRGTPGAENLGSFQACTRNGSSGGGIAGARQIAARLSIGVYIGAKVDHRDAAC